MMIEYWYKDFKRNGRGGMNLEKEMRATDGYDRIELHSGTDIDIAVLLLLEKKKAGEKVYADFNGHLLFSDTVTIDGAYKEITGETRAGFFAKREQKRMEYEQREREHKANIPQLTKEWVEKGHCVLGEKYWELWDKCVPIRLGDLYHGMELGATLEIVEKLNAGCSFAEAKKIIGEQGHSGMSYSLVCSMVKSFCDRGAAFVEELRNE